MLSIIINNIINIQHADANNADDSRPTRMPANNTPSIDPFQKERYSISTYLHTYFHRLSVHSVFTGTLRMKFRYVDAALLHQESMSVSPCCPLDKRLLLSITTWEWIISAANTADLQNRQQLSDELSARMDPTWTLLLYKSTTFTSFCKVLKLCTVTRTGWRPPAHYVGSIVQLAAVSRQERPFTRAFACIPPLFKDVWYTHSTMAITISLVEDTNTRATLS